MGKEPIHVAHEMTAVLSVLIVLHFYCLSLFLTGHLSALVHALPWLKCMIVCVFIQTRREREMRQQVENHDEETLELKETYSSLQQEVDIKTKKLKKVFKVLNVLFSPGCSYQ